MKYVSIFFLSLLSTGMFSYARQNGNGFPELTGPYLGQKPPGAFAELFAPGIISFGHHEHRLAISPDGTEIYFTVFAGEPARAMIMCSQLKNGVWMTPAVAPFSDSGMNLHPAFSTDGKRLYFASTRPRPDDNGRRHGADIWFVERQGTMWSGPVNLGEAINTEANESSPSVMSDGTLFFESNRGGDGKDWNIYVSRSQNGVRQKAEKLPSPIGTENEEGGPCIAADGRYLLFNSNRPGSFGESDIYVAFKDENGDWNNPINVGRTINSKFYDWSPVITPDGKYMVFSSCRNRQPIVSEHGYYPEIFNKNPGPAKAGEGSLYWLDASFIDELRKLEATKNE